MSTHREGIGGGNEDDGVGASRVPGSGWRALRAEREREFRTDFAPLRDAMRRNEFVSASVELFLSALVGVTKINLGAGGSERDDAADPTSRANGPKP